MTTERLQKALARAGIGSRRACEELIRQGRVQVDGVTATLGTKVDAERSTIFVDGKQLSAPEALVYIAVHKPAGILSVMVDDRGRPALSSLVDVPQRLYPVGRLDLPSEGLVLLTNDGRLAHRLSHPRFEHPKTYLTLVTGLPEETLRDRFRRGIMIDGRRSSPAEVRLLAEPPSGFEKSGGAIAGPCTWLEVTLREGRKRQVRRMCEAMGHTVLRLIRVAIGPLQLGSLPQGEWRELTPNELRQLKRSAWSNGTKST